MSRRIQKPTWSRCGEAAPEADEVGQAVRDVTYRLTHDLSDTPDDVRDAIALAPLAAIKLVDQCVSALAARPKRTLAALTALVLVLTGTALAWRNGPEPHAWSRNLKA